MTPEFREYEPRDADAVRDLLNDVFSRAYMSPAGWAAWTAEDFTAPVALLDGEPVGAIPLKRRTLRVAPDAEVVAWVEHRVGVREDLRDQGLGSGMQSCAKEFLRGRGDVLFVYRGAERTDGYRFYDRNGLHDVSYIRRYPLEPSDAAAPGTRWLDEEEFLARDGQWHSLFESCYGRFGGYPQRRPGYLPDIIRSVTWQEAMRHELSYCAAEDGGQPVGYAVLGRRDDAQQVMELAVRDGSPEHAARLLAAARGLGEPVSVRATTGSMLEALLRRMGLADPPREHAMMIMIHVVDPESTGRKVWRRVPALADVEVRVWTPEREGAIHAPAAPTRTLTLELKEHMLSRLLVRRLDVAAAVAEERITVCGARPGDAEALAQALAPCPWVYHQIDYL